MDSLNNISFNILVHYNVSLVVMWHHLLTQGCDHLFHHGVKNMPSSTRVCQVPKKSTSKFRVLRTQGALNLANLIENMAKNHIGGISIRQRERGEAVQLVMMILTF